jgi:hypothetical protein
MFVIVSKVFSIVLAGIVLSKSYLDFRQRRDSASMFVLWSLTWGGIVVVALFPQIIDVLIAYFGGGRTGLGTFFGMGLVFLFFVVYRVYVKFERLEQRLATLVQELALQKDFGLKDR